MLNFTINKKDIKNIYYIYLGVLEATTNFNLADQEKRVLAILLKNRKLDKNVKKELLEITSSQRIENILSKFRKKGYLINNEVSPKFHKFDSDSIKFTINVNTRN